MHILIIEDDEKLGESMREGLEVKKYAVDLVADGSAGLAQALSFPYDLLILDILLPGTSGWDICKKVRAKGLTTTILMLTALGGVEDRVKGLDSGADDYLCKPFEFVELEARVRALLRREANIRTAVLTFMDITLDTRTREVKRGDRIIELTNKQYALLEFMMLHPRHVLTRTMIADHLWDYTNENYSNVIDVYIGGLRRKLCENGEPDVIITIRGTGYQLREPQ